MKRSIVKNSVVILLLLAFIAVSLLPARAEVYVDPDIEKVSLESRDMVAGVFQCALGEGEDACSHYLGESYYFGNNLPEDKNKSFRWFMRGAANGFQPSLYFVGKQLIEGDGVQKNVSKGIGYLVDAAKKGSGRAPLQISEAYLKNASKASDRIEGYAWMIIASALDFNGNISRDKLKAYGLNLDQVELEASMDRAVQLADWLKAPEG